MKYSIVVATYNRKDALRKLIDSVFSQTYTNFELIVIDDGSTDGTDEMCKEIADERFIYERLSANSGSATPARNRGIDRMTGDALIIWDSDDLFLPHALETLQSGFEEYPEVGGVFVSTDFCRDGRKVEKRRCSTSVFTVNDWFSGKKPRDAEIIAIRKEYIGDFRFEEKGIDYVFYAKIVGFYKFTTYYINKTCGIVNLESDPLSLTTARRKRDNALSARRATILDDFLSRYGHMYIEAGNHGRYAAIAFGSSIGYLILKKYSKAREMMQLACKHDRTFSRCIILCVLYVPGGGYIMHKLLMLKDTL